MKKLLYILALFSTQLCFGQSQLDMTIESLDTLASSSEKLAAIEKLIIEGYKEDTVFVEAFKATQKQWEAFLMTEMNMKFPERGYGYYGSMHAMCYNHYRSKLINERIEQLKEWLKPLANGEGCGGSIKRRELE